ncbi:hypothetical protein FACS1894184_00290 [Clostridia bacterium]|nr:hypothetical protein FACS1894184_00290 [Clostridia bacterium]
MLLRSSERPVHTPGGKSSFQGAFYRCARGLVRLFGPKVKTPPREAFPEPAVFVCHHHNMRGPITTMAWAPVPLHPWSLAVFFKAKDLTQHFGGFTFSQRFGWPRPLAYAVAWLISAPISLLMRSMYAVPVYRKSIESIKTMRVSVDILLRGEPIVIYPDIQYDSDDERLGEMYRGFLLLERFYREKTGLHLPFVPLYFDPKRKSLRLGEPVLFPDGDMREHLDEVYVKIRDAVNALAKD